MLSKDPHLRANRLRSRDKDFYRRTLLAWSTREKGEEVPVGYRSEEAFRDTVNGRCKDWRFFITSKGFFGQVLGKPEVGDTIGVLYGSIVPLILRRVHSTHDGSLEQELESFTLVGQSYIHGIMDGEAMDALQSGEVKEKHIVLV